MRYFAILEILLILSEFNQTDVNRSVCEFYIRLVILRIPIKKAHHEKNQENWFENRDFWERIRIQFWRRLYPWNLTLNAMRLLTRSYSIDFMKIFTLPRKWYQIWPIKMIHAGSDTFTEWLSSNKILVHMSIIVMLKQRWACGLLIITKIKKYEVWISRAMFRDSWNIANLIRI